MQTDASFGNGADGFSPTLAGFHLRMPTADRQIIDYCITPIVLNRLHHQQRGLSCADFVAILRSVCRSLLLCIPLVHQTFRFSWNQLALFEGVFQRGQLAGELLQLIGLLAPSGMQLLSNRGIAIVFLSGLPAGRRH